MTERDHWSIGEVLLLVQEDFPDVTISKIRFLESQGLITPERTSSGYRRFHPQDLERLQWILSQQRDHYLPLKVIRDRLLSGDLDGDNEVDVAPTLQFGDEDFGSARRQPRTGQPLSKLVPDPEIAEVDAIDGLADGDVVDEEVVSASVSEPVGPQELSVPIAPVTVPSKQPEVSGQASGSERPRVPRMERRGESRGDRSNRRVEPIGANAALTKDELAEASGCSVETLIELERFGLLKGRTIGPTVLYDTEALRVSTIAAGFVGLGLEPRHLRTFKIDAEREVSLLSQVVEPLFYGKNDKARVSSLEALDTLVQLSADLREILVRQMVREQLPSQRG